MNPFISFIATRRGLATRLLAAVIGVSVVLAAMVSAAHPELSAVQRLVSGGRYAEADEALARILDAQPDNAAAHLLRGRLLEEWARDLRQEALESYIQALSDPTTAPSARIPLARIFLEQGEPTRALEILKPLSSALTGHGELYRLRGEAYYAKGELTLSLENLERARQYQPDNPGVLLRLGQVFEQKQLYEDAFAAYEHLLALKEVPPAAYGQAQARLTALRQKRTSQTVADLPDPAIRAIITSAPSAEEYPQAGALILLNQHEYVVRPDNTMQTRIHRIIKVLNVRGRERYGEVKLAFDSTYERIDVDLARTITPDGQIVRVGQRSIRTIDQWSGFPLYSNAKATVISMPEVVQGSIIEYRATITTTKLLDDTRFQIRFGLQSFEPHLRNRLTLTVPRGRTFHTHYVRLDDVQPQVTSDEYTTTYHWQIDHLPEIVSEPQMPPWADISPFIMISSFPSWDSFSQWWRRLSRQQPTPTAAIERKVAEITAGLHTPEARAQAIYHWIVTHVRYVGLEFGLAGYKPHTAAEIFENKYGDCKDKATLLLAMYRVARIPAYYVLVGTRQVGHLERGIPMSQFNHAIAVARLGDRLVWMDPTAETAAWGELPGSDQEQWALVFFPEEARFRQVPLLSPADNQVTHRLQVYVHPSRAVTVDYRLESRGAQDMQLRSFKYVKPAQREQIIQDWINSIAPGATLEDFAFSDLADYTQPVSLQVRYRAPDYLSRAGDYLVLRVPGAQRDALACGTESRRYPLVFSTTSAAAMDVTILLPPEFALEYVPDAVALQAPGLAYEYAYQPAQNALYYTSYAERATTRIPTKLYRQYKQFTEEAARRSKDHVLVHIRESGAP